MDKTIVDAWNGPGGRDGELTVVSPRDNALHGGDPGAFEHWYVDAHLDSGHTVIGFLTKRRPEQRPGCDPSIEMLVYHPDGTRTQVNASYPKKQASFSTESADVKIGPNSIRSEYPSDGLPVHHVHLEGDGLVFDLTFANEVPSWMPGSGRTTYGAKQYFGWVVPGPRARVSGTVQIGGETIDATGLGYHDHNWGVGQMPRIIDRWHWGRLYTPEFTMLFATVLTQKRWDRHMTTAAMIAQGDKIILSSGEFELTEGPMPYDDVAHRARPEWIRLSSPGEFDLRLDVRRISHAHDLLDDMPVVRNRAVKPLVRSLIGRPGYFRFESDYELTINVDGLDERLTGSTLHEMVALG